MNRQIERWQLVPPAISLFSGLLFGIVFFVLGHWGAYGILIPLLWINGLAIVTIVFGTSIARGDPNLGRAVAVFLGLLVVHPAVEELGDDIESRKMRRAFNLAAR